MMRAAAPWVVMLLGAISLVGCSKTEAATGLMVIIDGDAVVRDRAASLVVRIRGERGADVNELEPLTYGPEADAIGWPRSISIAPKDGDAERAVHAHIAAFEPGASTPFIQARLITSFEARQMLAVRVVLESTCIDADCDDTETCRQGECVDPRTAWPVEAYDPGADAGTPSPRDGGPEDSGGPDGSDAGDGDAAERRMFLSSARFVDSPAGRLAVVDLDDHQVRLAPTPNADVDTVVARAGDIPLALSRSDGLVRIQSQDDPLVTVRTIDINPPDQGGVPFAANPQGVVGIAPDHAYVVPRSLNALVIIDPRPGGASEPIGHVDLEPLMAPGDMDGVVDPVDAVRDGDRVYVGLARSWWDTGSFSMQFEGSVLAVVDTATAALVDMDPTIDGIQAIELEANLSGGGMVLDGHLLYVVATGAFGAWDGGIEVVDLNAATSLGLALREEDVERDITGLAWVSATRAYVLLATPSGVRVWNPSTGDLAEEDLVSDASGLRVHDGVLYVRSNGTLLRFDAETGAGLGGGIDVTAEPLFSMVPVR